MSSVELRSTHSCKPLQLFFHSSSNHTLNIPLLPGQLGKISPFHTVHTAPAHSPGSLQTWQSKQHFNMKQITSISGLFPFLSSPWNVSNLTIWFGTCWFGCCKADKKTNQIPHKIPINDYSRPRLKVSLFFLYMVAWQSIIKLIITSEGCI